MCNLSDGVERRGVAKGIINGKTEGRKEIQKEIALRMIHMGGFSLDTMAYISGLSTEQIKELMAEQK